MAIRTERRRDNTRTRGLLLAHALCIALLWCVAGGAHAASVYKCVDAHGHITFRDTPCAAHKRQTRLSIAGQPLIDPGAPRHTVSAPTSKPAPHSHSRHAHRGRKPTRPMSWKCVAADGEVFYRHSRCPGSVPGDGVVRDDYTQPGSRSRPRRRHNAWSRVPVHGVKIPRAEACRLIHSAGAAGRDGHQRDAHVSTYDHLMGRDPCTTS